MFFSVYFIAYQSWFFKYFLVYFQIIIVTNILEKTFIVPNFLIKPFYLVFVIFVLAVQANVVFFKTCQKLLTLEIFFCCCIYRCYAALFESFLNFLFLLLILLT